MAEGELRSCAVEKHCEVDGLKTGLSECSVRAGEGTDSRDTERTDRGFK